MNRRIALIFAGLLYGCVAQTPQNPYTPTPFEAIAVPPGARIVAYGHYPLAPFTPPREAGSLYVFDEDAHKVAFVTNYSEGAGTSTDLNQLSRSSFDPNHSYRVYFVPASAMAASQPTAAGQ